MTILTWNCCLPPWTLTRRQRLPKIVDAILSKSPDVVCLQEVFFESDANKIIKLLKTDGFVDFFHFKDLLVASKIKFQGKRGEVFGQQGSIFSLAIGDVVYGKGFQIVELNNNGETIFLANTHLLSAYARDSLRYQEPREKQVQEICQVMNELPRAEKIILGDFNFQPKTLPYKEFAKMHFKDDTTADHTTARRKIDYVLLNNNPGRKAKIAFFDTSLSDHAALTISL